MMTRATPTPGRLPRLARAALIGLFGVLAALWLVVAIWADDAPLPTLFLFGPRWVVVFPLLLIIPLAVHMRTYWGWALLAASTALVCGPLTGGRLSIGAEFRGESPGRERLRVATWNMAGKKPGPEFGQMLEQFQPDVLVAQECAVGPRDVPEGWAVYGEAGNKMITRLPARPSGSLDCWPLLQVGGRFDRFTVTTFHGDLKVVVLHLPTPRPGIEQAVGTKLLDLGELRSIIAIRSAASQAAREWIGPAGEPVVVAGDFNMPVESRIYQRNWSDFRNAFNQAGSGWGTTKQTRWFGVRIDHILYTPPWRCHAVWVGEEIWSDHRPVFADLVLDQ